MFKNTRRFPFTHLQASLPAWSRALVGLVVAVGGTVSALADDSALMPPAGLAWALVIAGGLVSGFLAGLLGIGGALVTIPTFYAVLPMLGTDRMQLPAAVVASALIAMVPTTLAAARRQRAYDALDTPWLKRLAPAMAAGAVLGAVLVSLAPGSWLGWAFAAQSLYYGGRLIVDHRDDGGASPRGLAAGLCRGPVWLAGAGMSAFCAAVGMGGGSLVVPFLRHRGLALRPAVATASTLNLCISFGGSAAFVFAAVSGAPVAGIHYPAALTLGLVAVLAAPLGVTLAHALPATRLRSLIGVVNVVAALTLSLQLIAAR